MNVVIGSVVKGKVQVGWGGVMGIRIEGTCAVTHNKNKKGLEVCKPKDIPIKIC